LLNIGRSVGSFQVEAALMNQSDNEELLALQQNLQEVIDLTLELIAQVRADVPLNSGVSKSASAASWSVGDDCIALWSEDGESVEFSDILKFRWKFSRFFSPHRFYEAKIIEIRDDGHCVVEFIDVEVNDVTPVGKPWHPSIDWLIARSVD
jgi:hypothetical protein